MWGRGRLGVSPMGSNRGLGSNGSFQGYLRGEGRGRLGVSPMGCKKGAFAAEVWGFRGSKGGRGVKRVQGVKLRGGI